MAKEERDPVELTEEDLAEQNGEQLPAREAMSLIDVGGHGGVMPLPDPIGVTDPGGPGAGAGGGEHTLPVEPPAES